MAILIIGISLGYWIGGRFASAPSPKKTVSREVGTPQEKPLETEAEEGERVSSDTVTANETEEGAETHSDRVEEEPRYTFYESLQEKEAGSTETSSGVGETERIGPSKKSSESVPEVAARPRLPTRESPSLVYYLQLASFREEERARKLADYLGGKGYSPEVVSAVVINRGIWYRVRIGPFGSEAEATEKAAVIEKTENLRPLVVREERENHP